MRLTSRLITLAWSAALVAPLGLMAAVAPAGAAVTAPATPGTAALDRAARAGASQWPQFGQSARHLGTNPAEKAFNPGNVSGISTLFTARFSWPPMTTSAGTAWCTRWGCPADPALPRKGPVPRGAAAGHRVGGWLGVSSRRLA